MRRRKTLANRYSCRGSDFRCGRPLLSCRTADDYGVAIRPSFFACCFELQGVLRATVHGSTVDAVDHGLEQEWVDEQPRSRSWLVVRSVLPSG